VLPTLPVSSWMCPVAVNALCGHPGRALSTIVFSSTMSASHLFLAGPRKVAESLTSVASFLLDLVWLDALNIPLSKDQSIVDYPFRCFGRVKLYP
jgi:hypothetical protein